MHDFCTYFDRHYLARGLALYRSLKEHCQTFRLWVLCMDRPSYDALRQMELPYLRLIALDELERHDKDLAGVRQGRSMVEYYFTCTPSLPLFILDTRPEVDMVTYLDADLFFYSDPSPLFEEIGDRSIAIIEHRFPPGCRHLEEWGIYNVGWVSFRRSAAALACLRWWRERCLEWCFDRVEDGRFADQKYLDRWPELFQDVAVLQNRGANLAPWNLANYRLTSKDGQLFVDGAPLIFFHFHGLRQLRSWLYDPRLGRYGTRPSLALFRGVYEPYLRSVSDIAERTVCAGRVEGEQHSIRAQGDGAKAHATMLRRIARGSRDLLRATGSIWSHRYITFVGRRVAWLGE